MSDHFSGPRAMAGPLCDICDVYTFPSPERPGHLVLIMDVLPNAQASSHFSDAIVYRFRLRPVTVASPGPAATFALGANDVTIDCTFKPPRCGEDGTMFQEGTCTAPSGESVSFVLNAAEDGAGAGFRVFAGLRSDPFFIDLPAFRRTWATGRLAFSEPGVNSLQGFDVLAVVVEIDCAKLLPAGSGSLVAVVGETVAAGKLPIRLERVGRPEIKNAILGAKDRDTVNRDLDIRDLYNLEDAFHVGPDYRGAYRARFNANLAHLDSCDGAIAWPLGDGGAHPLTELLLADFLVVDVSKPFSEEGFLEIETSMREGRAHQTCGGRSLNQNVMDTLYTLLIAGGKGPTLTDHVKQATVPASNRFPYVAPSNRPPAPPPADANPPHGHGNDGHDHHHHHFGR